MTIATKITVHGKVQGVFYRASAQKKAQDLGIVGWIQNLVEGTVEIFAQGSEAALIEFKAWCIEGPPQAKVSDLTSHEAETNPSLTSFQILNG
ncbi:MAG: hypothetical protein A2508_09860 [Candidatus Lambdaproteobacteria bacterium RIFOXYD12_FULL_49_8]|uniref:acylphosphatase n=1 Tax=Candidatus Lambdaproteobacteria bacterium RIFOXYD2_FULL_50_16 TaxID=1817772 RepID=A0A1F6GFM5_9PROT|nr:MAG: hypothetical protein A2527_00095 [Candidatus Lambdaproteobacteria bacterium RIFOXYD2_FULL_50_16]OGG97334.1 MAG: hypothetical protein A2508_09860 [Candidatus Lambdaproteobacteria bacterium RIFOXYD12_FULL_49_8]